MRYIITIEAFLFLLMEAGSYPLPVDAPEWTDPYYGHQN